MLVLILVCFIIGNTIIFCSWLINVRLASWNIGSLTGKSIELVRILHRRRISIACVQETRWVGAKAKEIDGFKL